MEPREKSSLGIDVDLACLLCYIGGPLTGGLMLLLEKRDLLIRFHAVQSCLAFAPSLVLIPIFFLIPHPDFVDFRFLYYMTGGGLIVATVALFMWIVPAAWRMERKRLPIVGRLADRYVPDDGRAESYKISGE